MLAEALITTAATYVLAGVVVAIAAHVGGLKRLDPAAGGAPVGFRLIITPGLAALWPLVLWRLVRGTPPDAVPVMRGWSTARLIHLLAWVVCPLLAVIIVLVATGARR